MPLTLTPSDLHPNLARKLQLRNGQAVRIYSIDGASKDFPVVGEFQKSTGLWCAARWTLSGWRCFDSIGDLDIIESPPALVTYTFQCEEGKTPLVFVPTGEVRPPKAGEYIEHMGVCHVVYDLCTNFKILKPVTPERAT